MIKNNINIISENERKKILEMHISATKKLYLNEQPFNDAGEPLMTYNQYKDWSEPSELELDLDGFDDYPEDIPSEFERELAKRDILLETWNGKEYFIRSDVQEFDFSIFFLGDDIKIDKYHNGVHDVKTFEDFDEALKYVLSHKPFFYTYKQSINQRNKEHQD